VRGGQGRRKIGLGGCRAGCDKRVLGGGELREEKRERNENQALNFEESLGSRVKAGFSRTACRNREAARIQD
jgi:hypothetical protein